jgi:hypothetical protein
MCANEIDEITIVVVALIRTEEMNDFFVQQHAAYLGMVPILAVSEFDSTRIGLQDRCWW